MAFQIQNKLNLDNKLVSFKVAKSLEEAIKKLYPKLKDLNILVEVPKNKEFGDFSTPLPLKLAKILKEKPLIIAENIVENLKAPVQIQDIKIITPGYINFYFSSGLLNHEITEISQKGEKALRLQISKKETVVIDFSSPNIAKPLGIHHLLSTIIGQSIYNIYKFLGFNVVSDNHLGDYGTQFGKLIYAYKKWGDKEKIQKNPNIELLDLYVKFHQIVKKDPKLDDFAREEFKKLEEGDKVNIALWKWFVKVSLDDIKKIYKKLGVSFDNYIGESFYNDKMEPIIKKGIKQKIFQEGEQGALIYKFENEELPIAIIRKKDGTTLYMTRDLAALEYRIKTWNPTKNIYVVDKAQSLHFKQLFEITEKLFPESKSLQNFHVEFGRMSFKDKKMSTREGNILLLEEVLEEAQKRAKELIESKEAETRVKNIDKASKSIGISSLKYIILSQNRTTDIIFDWDKMLTLDGNSAPYLQYTYARALSILRKNKEDLSKVLADLMEDGSKEYNLARQIAMFQENLYLSALEFKPNLLANYLYELAKEFNGFYNSVPVLTAKTKGILKMRIMLVASLAETLKTGMKLLCIDVLSEM